MSDGGTPRIALLATTATAVLVVVTGTFDQIIALFAVLFLINYVSAFLAVFVLRRRNPHQPRPYKAFGYPFTTAVSLAGSASLLCAAVYEDPRSGVAAAAFLACCIPVYAWLARNRGKGATARAALVTPPPD
jgi:APA family basic amino acid/polyamine antiporter